MRGLGLDADCAVAVFEEKSLSEGAEKSVNRCPNAPLPACEEKGNAAPPYAR